MFYWIFCTLCPCWKHKIVIMKNAWGKCSKKLGTFIVRQFIQYCFTHCCNMGLILCMNFLSAVICLSLLFFLVIVHVFVQLTYIVQHSMLYSFNGHVDIYTVKCQYHWSVVCQKSQSTLKLSFSNFWSRRFIFFSHWSIALLSKHDNLSVSTCFQRAKTTTVWSSVCWVSFVKIFDKIV